MMYRNAEYLTILIQLPKANQTVFCKALFSTKPIKQEAPHLHNIHTVHTLPPLLGTQLCIFNYSTSVLRNPSKSAHHLSKPCHRAGIVCVRALKDFVREELFPSELRCALSVCRAAFSHARHFRSRHRFARPGKLRRCPSPGVEGRALHFLLMKFRSCSIPLKGNTLELCSSKCFARTVFNSFQATPRTNKLAPRAQCPRNEHFLITLTSRGKPNRHENLPGLALMELCNIQRANSHSNLANAKSDGFARLDLGGVC
eukprot:4199212-Amphidinium_carterae.1